MGVIISGVVRYSAVLEGSDLAAVVEGPRLVALHMDSVTDTVQHVQQTRLCLLPWRFAVQTLSVLEGIRKTTPQEGFLLSLGLRGGRRGGREEVAVGSVDVAVETEVLQVDSLCGYAIVMVIGMRMAQRLLAGPDFEVRTEGVIVPDIFLVSLGRQEVLLLVDHLLNPADALEGMVRHLLHSLPRDFLHRMLRSSQVNCRVGVVAECIGVQETVRMKCVGRTGSSGCLSGGHVLLVLLFLHEHVNIINWKKEGSGPQLGLGIDEVTDLANVRHHLLGAISRGGVKDRVIDSLNLNLLYQVALDWSLFVTPVALSHLFHQCC